MELGAGLAERCHFSSSSTTPYKLEGGGKESPLGRLQCVENGIPCLTSHEGGEIRLIPLTKTHGENLRRNS